VSLDSSLREIEKNGYLDKWYLQTLQQIRAFGNPAVHRATTIDSISVTEQDLTVLLVCVCKLLDKTLQLTQQHRWSI
jgi:hypothetical protein